MYSDTIVLSGPEVMLSSSASVAASHSPRPQSVKRDYARLIGHFRHVSNPPSLRLVKEMLQAVARRVRVSGVQRPGGEG